MVIQEDADEETIDPTLRIIDVGFEDDNVVMIFKKGDEKGGHVFVIPPDIALQVADSLVKTVKKIIKSEVH